MIVFTPKRHQKILIKKGLIVLPFASYKREIHYNVGLGEYNRFLL